MARKRPAPEADTFVDASAQDQSPDQPVEAPARQLRQYVNSQTKNHDLYKCLPAKFLRDLSYNKDGSMRQEVEHAHFFHTIDSSGRDQNRTNDVGGHFHQVTVVQSKNPDELPTVTCGPAVMWQVQGKGRTAKRVLVHPLIAKDTDAEEIDTHTHEMVWDKSEKITLRKGNPEAAEAMRQIAQKQEIRVPGITG